MNRNKAAYNCFSFSGFFTFPRIYFFGEEEPPAGLTGGFFSVGAPISFRLFI
jgi:hypothetical protein